MSGTPIQVAEPVPSENEREGSDRFRFNSDLPRQIGSPERLSKARVVIISVAGAFRKGKSFLLNFFLRYLRALSRGDTRDWILSAEDLENGFHWRGGCERDTAGILIWSEPFFIPQPSGEEVAVLLMDTQGAFDHQSTQQDCTTIFAFSTLLSSVQIFNISQNIQETDLQYLRLFVEFAAMAKNSKEKVLQHLWFLVRDWQNPDEHEFGVDGGQQYLEKVLACDDRKPRENQELRRGIRRHFEKASCCLLPYPGSAVRRSIFRGAVHELERDFVENLEQFVPHILSPANLVVKKINGKELTGQELFQFVEVYNEAFRCGKLPTPKSIFIATVEMANLTAASDAQKFFEDSLKSLCDPTKAVSDQELDGLLHVMLEQAMLQFDSKCMEAESRDTVQMRKRLDEQLRGLFLQQHVLNRLKSDRIAADEKNQMLMGDIRRMQEDSLKAQGKMCELERVFAEKVREIQSQAISKEQMEKLLQEELVRHSAAQKELERKNEDLMTRIDDMARKNRKLADDLKENRQQALLDQQRMNEEWEQKLEVQFEERQKAARAKELVLLKILPAVAAVGVSVATSLARSGKCSIS